jgi:hypothetical protein
MKKLPATVYTLDLHFVIFKLVEKLFLKKKCWKSEDKKHVQKSGYTGRRKTIQAFALRTIVKKL